MELIWNERKFCIYISITTNNVNTNGEFKCLNFTRNLQTQSDYIVRT